MALVTKLALGYFVAGLGLSSAFQTRFANGGNRPAIRLHSTIDKTVVTTKEFQDVCGKDFDSHEMGKRLERTEFLYPSHVAAIDAIAPLAAKAVDDIVSAALVVWVAVHYKNLKRKLTKFCFCRLLVLLVSSYWNAVVKRGSHKIISLT
jgi:hypothetical protein